ncbi:hypothetical protein KEM48_013483 [Puccinia striiformis f. sp. tritici PST-130]|nr:hypothetical protein KEM48_013483 [Puccinia striiformis f. sp. tritici PST-130]
MPSLPTKKPVKVLLTGFGEIIIAISYPPHQCLLRDSEKSDSKIGETVEGVSGREVEVVGHREPIRVSYKSVDELLSELYETHPDIDLVIHTGLNATLAKSEFLIETIAHRDRYVSPMSTDSSVMISYRSQRGNSDRQWAASLSSSVLVAPLIQQVKAQISVPIELKASTDAGRYLCELYTTIILRSMGETTSIKTPPKSHEKRQKQISLTINLETHFNYPLIRPCSSILGSYGSRIRRSGLHTIVQEIITLHSRNRYKSFLNLQDLNAEQLILKESPPPPPLFIELLDEEEEEK